MSDSRVAFAVFCDDFRQEIGNKYSLMGCYGPELIIDNIPAALPRLCARIQVSTAIDRPFQKLTFRIRRDEEVLGEYELPSEQLIRGQNVNKEIISSFSDRMSIMAILSLTPLLINEPMILRTEVETESELLPGSGISIRLRTPKDSQVVTG